MQKSYAIIGAMLPSRILCCTWAVLLPALLLPAVRPIHAQTFDFHDDPGMPVTLNGLWRFHAGDNPAWADPRFDDSRWSLLSTDGSWAEQGYKGYGGLAWYRMRVQLPAQQASLALYFSRVVDSCEVFANGRLIGHIGGLRPVPKIVSTTRAVIPIPDDDLIPGRPLLIAIRVWEWPSRAAQQGGGIYPAPRIGEVDAIKEWAGLQQSRMVSKNTAGLIEIYGNFLTALASLALFALQRKEREYLWWGVSQLCGAFFGVARLYAASRPVGYFAAEITLTTLSVLASYLQIEFLVTLLRQRRGVIYYIALFFVLWMAIGSLSDLFLTSEATAFGFLLTFGLNGLILCEVALLYLGAKRRNVDAWILLVPYSTQFCVAILQLLTAIPSLAGSLWIRSVPHFFQVPASLQVGVIAAQISGAFEMYAVLVVLVLRYVRSRKDEERMEAELEAARTVQRVLIPQEVPAIPGLAVQTVYKPASQVGGDFFQIIPLDSGGALVVIGDVSGKGMPAAMTVSLLVGTFRTLAHYTQCPGEILSAMNIRMLARSKGGFTTCLVLRLDTTGTVTLANAGHLSPYLAGKELQLENGLPLGLTDESRYIESTYSLAVATTPASSLDFNAQQRSQETRLNQLHEPHRNSVRRMTLQSLRSLV